METICGFLPIANAHSRILILGSMPGVASLRKEQYYGHPQNAFWRVMSALLCEPFSEDYGERTAMLLRHGVALWDVVHCCERTGSLDAHIKNPEINDFASFFSLHPGIRRICFNGQTAYTLFKRNVGFNYPEMEFIRLGSTSPAHAVTLETRLADWRRILPLPRIGEG